MIEFIFYLLTSRIPNTLKRWALVTCESRIVKIREGKSSEYEEPLCLMTLKTFRN